MNPARIRILTDGLNCAGCGALCDPRLPCHECGSADMRAPLRVPMATLCAEWGGAMRALADIDLIDRVDGVE